MLVHYFRIERGSMRVDRLFDPPRTPRLPDVNWAGYVAFFAGIACTWLFMYGVTPLFQGPIATAMGGVDLSWLAGGLVSAGVYAVLGPIVAAKYDGDRFASPARETPAARTAPLGDVAPEVIA